MVVVGADIAQELAVYVVRILGIAKARVEVDTPSCAPACGSVSFELQCPGCSLVDVLAAVYTILYGMARVYSEEVALMAVVGVFILPVVVPFLQVALSAYLVWQET